MAEYIPPDKIKLWVMYLGPEAVYTHHGTTSEGRRLPYEFTRKQWTPIHREEDILFFKDFASKAENFVYREDLPSPTETYSRKPVPNEPDKVWNSYHNKRAEYLARAREAEIQARKAKVLEVLGLSKSTSKTEPKSEKSVAQDVAQADAKAEGGK